MRYRNRGRVHYNSRFGGSSNNQSNIRSNSLRSNEQPHYYSESGDRAQYFEDRGERLFRGRSYDDRNQNRARDVRRNEESPGRGRYIDNRSGYNRNNEGRLRYEEGGGGRDNRSTYLRDERNRHTNNRPHDRYFEESIDYVRQTNNRPNQNSYSNERGRRRFEPNLRSQAREIIRNQIESNLRTLPNETRQIQSPVARSKDEKYTEKLENSEMENKISPEKVTTQKYFSVDSFKDNASESKDNKQNSRPASRYRKPRAPRSKSGWSKNSIMHKANESHVETLEVESSKEFSTPVQNSKRKAEVEEPSKKRKESTDIKKQNDSDIKEDTNVESKFTPTSPQYEGKSSNTFGSKYKREACIGQGRYGQVWKAYPTFDSELVKVALKRTNRNNGHIPTTTMREAKFLMQLDHVNICKQHEIGAGTSSIYSVLDYCNFDLVGLVHSFEKRMPLDLICSIMFQFLQGLDYIHCKGIVHRVMNINIGLEIV
eukprot:NODE_507_length_6688_cov_1.276673.p2 type:complete len:485 gc:universal NODE_507_length_6688_cov_1.276673:2149-695(-)